MARIINQWMLVSGNLDLERIKCIQRKDGIVSRTGDGFQSTRKSSRIIEKENLDKPVVNSYIGKNGKLYNFAYFNTFKEMNPEEVIGIITKELYSKTGGLL